MKNKESNKHSFFDKSKVLKGNALLKHKPELIGQWDFEKNDELGLDIYNVSEYSSKEAWWVCENGHSYRLSIKLKSKGIRCGYCTSRRLLVGFNDLATTNPSLHSLLLNQEDGYKYMQYSKFRLDWKCPNCGKHIKNKKIADVNVYGLSCTDCSDGIKYPEKVMREILNQLQVEFIRDEPFRWSNDKRYDFYIPSLNTIIETHGGQHYNGGFKTYNNGNTLEHELQNDTEKERLAILNNIEKYVVINCRKSEIDFIKNSILDSELSIIFDLSIINWTLVEKNAQKSISYESLLLWNGGCRDIEEIASKLSIHREAVRRYLKQWSKIGKCDFGAFSKSKRKIIQLDKNYQYIKEWESISEASLNLSGKKSSRIINNHLNGSVDFAYGFKWMYKSDYESFLVTGKFSEPTIKRVNSGNIREVVKLSMNNEFLEVYPSIAIAANDSGIKAQGHITSCCRRKRNYCGGFKWMYKEDYDKLNIAI